MSQQIYHSQREGVDVPVEAGTKQLHADISLRDDATTGEPRNPDPLQAGKPENSDWSLDLEGIEVNILKKEESHSSGDRYL